MNALVASGAISASSMILLDSVCDLLICELNSCAMSLNT
jgi:hypothetical protein